MKRIQAYKLWDILLLLLAITLPWAIYALFPGPERLFHLEHVMMAYLVAGIVQVVSCVVNWRLLPKEYRQKNRHWYETILAVLAAMGIIATVMKSLLLLLMLLFYIVPVMTAWYICICIAELVKITRNKG